MEPRLFPLSTLAWRGVAATEGSGRGEVLMDVAG